VCDPCPNLRTRASFGRLMPRAGARRGGAEAVVKIFDKIVLWAQNASGVRYLVPAQAELDQSEENTSNFILCGEHVFRTRCPQRFGWFELNHFMVDNGYITPAADVNAGASSLFSAKTSVADITNSAGAA